MDAPERKRIEAQQVAALRHVGSHDDIGQVYRRLYEWARAKGLAPAGPACTVFLTPPSAGHPERAEYEVCLPVSGTVKSEGNIQVKTLPAATVAAVRVRGPYSDIGARYTELLAWLAAEGLDAEGPPREVYLRHPGGEGDPADFLTEIQVPVAQ